MFILWSLNFLIRHVILLSSCARLPLSFITSLVDITPLKTTTFLPQSRPTQFASIMETVPVSHESSASSPSSIINSPTVSPPPSASSQEESTSVPHPPSPYPSLLVEARARRPNP